MKTTKWKLHWLPNIAELVPLRLVDFDHLITKKKLEEGDAIEDFVNKNSVRRLTCLTGMASCPKKTKNKTAQCGAEPSPANCCYYRGACAAEAGEGQGGDAVLLMRTIFISGSFAL